MFVCHVIDHKCLSALTIFGWSIRELKGPGQPQRVVFVYMREFGYYILFGAFRNERNHCGTSTKDNYNILSGTQLTVKQ